MPEPPLRIRPEQLRALSEQRKASFERRAIEELHRIYPEDCADMRREELVAFVQRMVANSLGYGIDDEDDILAYLFLAIEHGEDFDKDPALPVCLNVLPDPELPGASKIQILYDLLVGAEG
jgi:hypothetical protein